MAGFVVEVPAALEDTVMGAAVRGINEQAEDDRRIAANTEYVGTQLHIERVSTNYAKAHERGVAQATRDFDEVAKAVAGLDLTGAEFEVGTETGVLTARVERSGKGTLDGVPVPLEVGLTIGVPTEHSSLQDVEAEVFAGITEETVATEDERDGFAMQTDLEQHLKEYDDRLAALRARATKFLWRLWGFQGWNDRAIGRVTRESDPSRTLLRGVTELNNAIRGDIRKRVAERQADAWGAFVVTQFGDHELISRVEFDAETHHEGEDGHMRSIEDAFTMMRPAEPTERPELRTPDWFAIHRTHATRQRPTDQEITAQLKEDYEALGLHPDMPREMAAAAALVHAFVRLFPERTGAEAPATVDVDEVVTVKEDVATVSAAGVVPRTRQPADGPLATSVQPQVAGATRSNGTRP